MNSHLQTLIYACVAVLVISCVSDLLAPASAAVSKLPSPTDRPVSSSLLSSSQKFWQKRRLGHLKVKVKLGRILRSGRKSSEAAQLSGSSPNRAIFGSSFGTLPNPRMLKGGGDGPSGGDRGDLGHHGEDEGHHEDGVGHHPDKGHHGPGVGHHPNGGHHFGKGMHLLPGQRCKNTTKNSCDKFVKNYPGFDTCCPRGKKGRIHACTNIQSDFKNCGACGNLCPEGFECCGGLCTNVLSNSSACGSCFIQCDSSTRCIGGICEFYGSHVSFPETSSEVLAEPRERRNWESTLVIP